MPLGERETVVSNFSSSILAVPRTGDSVLMGVSGVSSQGEAISSSPWGSRRSTVTSYLTGVLPRILLVSLRRGDGKEKLFARDWTNVFLWGVVAPEVVISGLEDFCEDLENPVAQLPRELSIERPLPKSDDGVLNKQIFHNETQQESDSF